jgi:ribosomal-protein-alanine N-acetyltransferase
VRASGLPQASAPVAARAKTFEKVPTQGTDPCSSALADSDDLVRLPCVSYHATAVMDLRLHTPRLVLRPLEVADAEALWPFVSDPDLPRLMDWDAHQSLAQTRDFLAAMVKGREQGTDFAWAMVEEGAIVGKIGLHEVTRNHRAWRVDRGELGYWLGAAHRRRGLVTEAAREVVRFAFEDLGLRKVTVNCIAENEPSKRVIETLGFRFIGVQRDHLFRFERWWDYLAYEMLVRDWQPPPAG